MENWNAAKNLIYDTYNHVCYAQRTRPNSFTRSSQFNFKQHPEAFNFPSFNYLLLYGTRVTFKKERRKMSYDNFCKRFFPSLYIQVNGKKNFQSKFICDKLWNK